MFYWYYSEVYQSNPIQGPVKENLIPQLRNSGNTFIIYYIKTFLLKLSNIIKCIWSQPYFKQSSHTKQILKIHHKHV